MIRETEKLGFPLCTPLNFTVSPVVRLRYNGISNLFIHIIVVLEGLLIHTTRIMCVIKFMYHLSCICT